MEYSRGISAIVTRHEIGESTSLALGIGPVRSEINDGSERQRTTAMRNLFASLLAIRVLSPSAAGACGLSGPWYVSSYDGYTGIFVIEKVVDGVRSCP